MAPGVTGARDEAGTSPYAAAMRRPLLVIIAIILTGWTAAGTVDSADARPAYPTVRVAPTAAPPAARAQIERVNAWWVRNRDFVPCAGCMVRPPQSALIWTYYRDQGFYPNWVRAARDVLRHKIRGNTRALREGTAELLANTTLRRLPSGVRYRTIRSAYTAPDGERPPWRDAMGQGLVLTTVVMGLPDDPTRAQLTTARLRADELLTAFGVNWRSGGITAPGRGRGLWYLEYAYATGERARVLNGFMQAIVSLDRFSRQANTMGRIDPAWYPLRDRAQDLVKRGTIELVRNISRYDNGDGWSRYSLTRPGRAPETYHVYHLQLLARLAAVDYLPAGHRAVLSRYQTRWGGAAIRSTTSRDPVPVG